MARRRGHRECARRGVEKGCEVLVGRSCGGGEGKGIRGRFMAGGWLEVGMGRWVREVVGGEVVLWWMIVGLVVTMIVNLWVGLGKGDVLGMVVAGEGEVWSVGGLGG